ncbi:hypothetical protein AKJ09_09830 [Labilithrix luteola]|uniref:Uncharacterized protein n=1 Tax=Labilithrix luteola TaxID=1391654 RepID=A0A0K1QBW4_9BACT|nr:hypothetical protein [Labilithrix luteola]AKV03167.1 hypothetical protein AKJ09_09830 [Labilithrix luteola]
MVDRILFNATVMVIVGAMAVTEAVAVALARTARAYAEVREFAKGE